MAQTNAERRAQKLGLYIVFKARRSGDEVPQATDASPSAFPPEPDPAPALSASGLVDKIFTDLKGRMAEDQRFRADPQRLAALRDDIRQAVTFAGPHAAEAFAEAWRLYKPLPGDYGHGLMVLFYSVASEMRRDAKYDPPSEIDEPPTGQISQLRQSTD